ncbi:MAG: DNA methyltransferase [Candidatus Dormibacteria bacterium]
MIFEFDNVELNFGVYRVYNLRRAQIEAFISERLPAIAKSALADYEAGLHAADTERMAHLRSQVLTAFGESAIGPDGALSREFATTPLGTRYEEARVSVGEVHESPDTFDAVYNHLFEFFSRYYVDGDFQAARRYSSSAPFSVPYDGRELLLHWPNRGQYYVKSSDTFTQYQFLIAGLSVSFQLQRVDPGDNEEAPSFILLPSSGVLWDADKREVRASFERRPLSEEEAADVASYPKPQPVLRTRAVETILSAVPPAEQAVLATPSLVGDLSVLERHVARFTSRNSSDFFVHPSLRTFLIEELGVYLASLAVGSDKATPAGLRSRLTHIQAVRSVAEPLIDLLGQVESLQAALFDKPKFVTRTDYLISLSQLPTALQYEACANDAQIRAWRDLDGIPVELANQLSEPESIGEGFPAKYPHLPVDTALFAHEFRWRVLAALDDIDASLSGILVCSDAFHALRLLHQKFSGSLQAVYCDPPFNTETDQFLYKDRYRTSTWLTMLDNRIKLVRPLLTENGSFYLHLDHNSNYLARYLMDATFGADSFHNEIIWRIGWLSGYKTSADRYIRNHETILLYGNGRPPYFDKSAAYLPFQAFEKASVKDPVAAIATAWGLPRDARLRKLQFSNEVGLIYKTGLTEKEGRYPLEDTWNCSDYDELNSNKIKRNVAEYTPHGSVLTQKPEQLLERVLTISTAPGDWVADFFGGTGTTAAVAHKMGRKYVLVEAREYFDSDVLWRMRQVIAGRQVGISKRTGFQGGGFVKYQYLETYDDTLANLTLEADDAAVDGSLKLFGDEYLTRYSLIWGVLDSLPLLRLEAMHQPFKYELLLPDGTGRLAPQAVDLVETFNYVTGLAVRKIRHYRHADTDYVAVLGELPGAPVVVLWRDTAHLLGDGTAQAAEQEFVVKMILPDLGFASPDNADIYMNGLVTLSGARMCDEVLRLAMSAAARAVAD